MKEKNEAYEYIGKLALEIYENFDSITYSELCIKMQEKFGDVYSHAIAMGAGVKAASKYWEQRGDQNIVVAIRHSFMNKDKNDDKQTLEIDFEG